MATSKRKSRAKTKTKTKTKTKAGGELEPPLLIRQAATLIGLSAEEFQAKYDDAFATRVVAQGGFPLR